MGVRSETGTALAPAGRGAPYLDGLNPEQLAAVMAPDGPLLVLAGAGTGKTRVLTTRLAHILLTGRARPQEVLAVTFTNRAAREMVERVERLIGRSVAGHVAGHLPRHGRADAARPCRAGRAAAQLHHPRHRRPGAAGQADRSRRPTSTSAAGRRALLVAIIQRWKDRGYRPDQVPASEIGDFALGRACALYAAYQQRLATLNACDFGDLLLHGLTLLTQQPDLLAALPAAVPRDPGRRVPGHQRRPVSLAAAARPAGTRTSPASATTTSRSTAGAGAEVGNILRFEQDFPGAQVIRLERNYRSTGHILGAASGVIAHNRARHGKTLWTEDEQGEQVRVAGLWDDQEEARFVADEVEAWQRAGRQARASRRCWCGPASRPAPSRSASSSWACPTG